MSEATELHTTTLTSDDCPRWAIGDLEPVIRDLQGALGALNSMAMSQRDPREGDWLAVIDMASGAADSIKALWKQAFEQSFGERKATEAAKAALKAAQDDRAMPGSAADAKRLDAAWHFLRTTAGFVLERSERGAGERPEASPIEAAPLPEATSGGAGDAPPRRIPEQPDAALIHIAREFAEVEAQIQVLNELPDGAESARMRSGSGSSR